MFSSVRVMAGFSKRQSISTKSVFIIMATLLEIAMQTQHTLISLQPQSPLLKIIIKKRSRRQNKKKRNLKVHKCGKHSRITLFQTNCSAAHYHKRLLWEATEMLLTFMAVIPKKNVQHAFGLSFFLFLHKIHKDTRVSQTCLTVRQL